MRDFYQRVSGVLEQIVEKEFGVQLEPPLWGMPSKQAFGDLSSMAALKLASKLKQDSLKIATNLKIALEKELGEDIEKIEILKPGFVNIFVSKKILLDSLTTLLKKRDDFFRHKLKRKILIEFVSANPTGPLSIAHGRQAVVGDTIANILEFFGNEVEREYYVNDEGKQIELFVESVKALIRKKKGQDVYFPKEGYRGEYVKDVAVATFRKSDRVLKKVILGINIKLIEKDLRLLGIKFDNWVSQKKLIDDGKVEEVIKFLRRKDLIDEKEGALWFVSTKFGDDKDRVIRKADGELTYFASDIAYHKDKIERKHNKLINLWGPDHHGYIKRVEAAIEALGYKKDILKIIIIQLVALKTKERMSKRAGTAISLSDLIKNVGKDATRFYYLTRKNSSHLEFDIDLAREASFNNPLYYIQYACARIESIFRKAKQKDLSTRYNKFLKEEEELSLIRQLLQFFYCLEKAYYSLEPVFIIEYLKNLASSLHKFYEQRRVLEEDKNIMYARLNLLTATRIVLHCALNLLGITPVKRM